EASLMSANQLKCASLIAKQVKSAGKKYIKTLMTCGQFCSALDQMTANSGFDSATTRITGSSYCDAATLSALLPGGLNSHITTVKAGAQRAVNGLTPGANPVVSSFSPLPGTVLNPLSLPANVQVLSVVSNVPHAGYVSQVEINGAVATYNQLSGRF